MVGEKVDFSEAQAREQETAGKQQRQRSTIEFPYLSLEAAEEVASAIYARCGLSPCEIDELAAQMGQTVSGAFRQKTAAAKIFGAVDKDGRSAFVLTGIGRKLAVDETKAEGRADAFLAVPLYAEIYDEYRGKPLPPAKALENVMEKLGVANKQTDRARQAFERSAQYAGFFELGSDKLVKPRADTSHTPQPLEGERMNGGGNGGGGDKPPIDPIIQGLLDRLPKSGDDWPESQRKLWIELLEGSFKLIYNDPETTKEPLS